MSSGFSDSTWSPARRASSAIRLCSGCGTAITAASAAFPASSSRQSAKRLTPGNSRSAHSSRSCARSQTAERTIPGTFPSAMQRAWALPMWPIPITAVRMFSGIRPSSRLFLPKPLYMETSELQEQTPSERAVFSPLSRPGAEGLLFPCRRDTIGLSLIEAVQEREGCRPWTSCC